MYRVAEEQPNHIRINMQNYQQINLILKIKYIEVTADQTNQRRLNV